MNAVIAFERLIPIDQLDQNLKESSTEQTGQCDLWPSRGVLNIIESIVDMLKKYPEARHEHRSDAIRVLAPNEEGYEVALLIRPEGRGYTVCLATWHMEFADEHSAIGTFLGGLSEAYRLKVASRGNVDYRWTIQYKDANDWIDGSTVGIFSYPFWKRKKVRYLQNNLIPLPRR